MISRAVPLTEEQYLFIEDLGKEFVRADQLETAKQLLDIARAWGVSPIVASAETVFACHVDESGGMADVVELNGYSRKTPCA